MTIVAWCNFCGNSIKNREKHHTRVFGDYSYQKGKNVYHTKFVGVLCSKCAVSPDADTKWLVVSQKAKDWESWRKLPITT